MSYYSNSYRDPTTSYGASSNSVAECIIEELPSRILQLSISKLNQDITVDHIYAVCNRDDCKVLRIVISDMLDKSGVTVSHVEFKSIQEAARIQAFVDKRYMFADSCFMEARFARINKLHVRKNTKKKWDSRLVETSKTKRVQDSDKSSSQDYKQVESSAGDYKQVKSSSRDYKHQVESSFQDYEQVEGSSRDYKQVEGSSRNYKQVQSSSLDYKQLDSSFRNYEEFESSSGNYEQFESSVGSGLYVDSSGYKWSTCKNNEQKRDTELCSTQFNDYPVVSTSNVPKWNYKQSESYGEHHSDSKLSKAEDMSFDHNFKVNTMATGSTFYPQSTFQNVDFSVRMNDNITHNYQQSNYQNEDQKHNKELYSLLHADMAFSKSNITKLNYEQPSYSGNITKQHETQDFSDHCQFVNTITDDLDSYALPTVYKQTENTRTVKQQRNVAPQNYENSNRNDKQKHNEQTYDDNVGTRTRDTAVVFKKSNKGDYEQHSIRNSDDNIKQHGTRDKRKNSLTDSNDRKKDKDLSPLNYEKSYRSDNKHKSKSDYNNVKRSDSKSRMKRKRDYEDSSDTKTEDKSQQYSDKRLNKGGGKLSSGLTFKPAKKKITKSHDITTTTAKPVSAMPPYPSDLKAVTIPLDGNSLFSSIAYHIFGSTILHRVARLAAVDHMKQHFQYFNDKFRSPAWNRSFTAFLDDMSQLETHGDELCLLALTEVYKLKIEVYIYGRSNCRFYSSDRLDSDINKTITLYFNGTHYVPLVLSDQNLKIRAMCPSPPRISELQNNEKEISSDTNNSAEAKIQKSEDKTLCDEFLSDHLISNKDERPITSSEDQSSTSNQDLKKGLQLLTINVRGFESEVKQERLRSWMQYRKVQIVAFQEMSTQVLDTLDWPGYHLIKHDHHRTKAKCKSCGFIIKESLVSLITKRIDRSSNVQVLYLRFLNNMLCIINAYAPELMAFEKKQNGFYQSLSVVLDQANSHELKPTVILVGDFNGHIGCNDVTDLNNFNQTALYHRISNEAGHKLIQIIKGTSLVQIPCVPAHPRQRDMYYTAVAPPQEHWTFQKMISEKYQVDYVFATPSQSIEYLLVMFKPVQDISDHKLMLLNIKANTRNVESSQSTNEAASSQSSVPWKLSESGTSSSVINNSDQQNNSAIVMSDTQQFVNNALLKTEPIIKDSHQNVGIFEQINKKNRSRNRRRNRFVIR